ncbi:AraC family ligand binding domain-containing protein [Paenibacillus elgii]
MYSHYHNDVFEILLVQRGSAEFRIGGQRLKAVPSDISLINEGKIHEGSTLDDEAEYCAFLFDRTRIVHSHVAHSDYAASLTEPLSVPVHLSPADAHYEPVAACFTPHCGRVRPQGNRLRGRHPIVHHRADYRSGPSLCKP